MVPATLMVILFSNCSMTFSSESETISCGIPRHSISNRLLKANSADLLSINYRVLSRKWGIQKSSYQFSMPFIFIHLSIIFGMFSFVRFSIKLPEIDLRIIITLVTISRG